MRICQDKCTFSCIRRAIEDVRIVVILALTATLFGCGLEPPHIEWDKYDPKLHGKVVHFNVPMVYVLLEPERAAKGGFMPEEIKIGRLLDTEEEYNSQNGWHDLGYMSEQVAPQERFIVKASYWERQNWLERGFSGDTRRVVLVNSQGIISTADFYIFSHSDRPNLQNLASIGKLR